MSEFTKGPWIVERSEDGHIIRMGSAIENRGYYRPHHIIEYSHGLFLYYDDGGPVSAREQEQYREAEANARLIVAAPLMYEALQEIIDAEDEAELGYYTIGRFFALSAARKALAKARGDE